MKEYVDANRRMWNTWAPFHVASEFYDVEGFKAGARRRRHGLDALEVAALGDVCGKSLLHLQCHFGLDSIAWARRGAVVTGVDFSETALAAARELASATGVATTFVQSDLYELPQHLDAHFDVVFTSHGALCWLPDLERWAGVVAHFLRPGGIFYVIEAHPFALLFDDRRKVPGLRPMYPYFHGPDPLREEQEGSYAVPSAPFHSVSYVWLHRLDEILGALLRAGLRIVAFEEYPFVGWAMFPWMEERADGCWQLPGGAGDLPLMFSLKATKDP